MPVREIKRVLDLPVSIEPDILYVQKSPSFGMRALLKSETSNKLSIFGRTVWLKGAAVVPYTPSVQGSDRQTSVYTLLNFDSFTYYHVTVDQPNSLPMAERFSLVDGILTLKLPTVEECPSGRIRLSVNNEISMIDLSIVRPDAPTIIYPMEGYSDDVSTSPVFYLTEFSSRVGDVLTTNAQKIQLEIYSDNGLSSLHSVFYSDQASTVVVSGLSHDTEYWARARYNGLSGGWGDWSAALYFSTVTDPH